VSVSIARQVRILHGGAPGEEESPELTIFVPTSPVTWHEAHELAAALHTQLTDIESDAMRDEAVAILVYMPYLDPRAAWIRAWKHDQYGGKPLALYASGSVEVEDDTKKLPAIFLDPPK
jgi:hypothetical protein